MQIDNNLYDLVIVGGGPAGLSAAIYMARAKYRVLVLEKSGIGGQIAITSDIVNYPGVEKASGKDLTEQMRLQAEAFGAEFAIAEVLDMELKADIKILHTTKSEYRALGVILATGANPRKLGFKGEQEYQGRGVAYCATCDGEFFDGLEVFVIGGGYAAVEEGLFLTKYAKKVTIVVRNDSFSCAKTVSDQLKDQEKIEVLFETELVEVGGKPMLSYAKFRNNHTKEEWVHEAGEKETFGIFVFAGYVPNTEWIGSELKKDPQGYLLTDSNQKTNLDGVYAAGDVCVKELRQVVTAVSDGATAATALEQEISELHSRLGIPDLYKDQKTQDQQIDRQPMAEEGFITADVRQQLSPVFSKFERPVLLKLWLDDSSLSDQMIGFMREMDSLTDKITWEEADSAQREDGRLLPSIELCYEDGSSSGIQFHGVPGGHEFNSFVIALYNVAGPGQTIDAETENRLKKIKRRQNLKILVSLSCTMCPETVMSAQKAAAISGQLEAEMFDLAHFPVLKEKYNVMSVPCLILDDEKVFFGKKGITEIAELLA